MKVVIRVDAAVRIGTGHVMRCLTLAHALKQYDCQVYFICRLHEGHLFNTIEQQGFEVYLLELTNHNAIVNTNELTLTHAEWLGATQKQDADACRPFLIAIQPDWLIVDHYAIDHVWQSSLSDCYRRLMVIDDLNDRSHLADLLLNQNFGVTDNDYHGRVKSVCKLLTGASYALLRPEFSILRDKSLARRNRPQLKNLLITLGGSDPDNITGQLLKTLKSVPLIDDLYLRIIMGANAVHLTKVVQEATTLPCKTDVLVNINNMAEVMVQADLAIGAAGATTWERCCLGLPTIQLVIAFNQRRVAEELARAGLVKTVDNVAGLPLLLADAPNWMVELSHKSAQICDGLGCQRVVAAMFE